MAISTRRIKEIVNFFRLYRGESQWTNQELIDNYRARDYEPPTLYQPAEPGFNQWPAPAPPKPTQALTDLQRTFLDSKIPDLEDVNNTIFNGGPGNWKGTKILGIGGNGMAALWEYEGPEGVASQEYRQVVVKEAIGDNPDIDNMAHDNLIHGNLLKTKSPHVNHAFLDGLPDPAWNGFVKRLILEYCPLGDARQLIQRFQRLGRPLKETSLWKIFECLIDGISVLETGNELSFGSPNYEVQRRNRKSWEPIIHFDLKPGNIFLNEDRFSHFVTPICKIGDFGLAVPVDDFFGDDKDTWGRRLQHRDHGTEGYFAPEQFTEEWEFRDYKKSEIAGKYSFETNIWGIGCIMYQLVLLTARWPDPKTPVTPSWDLNGKPAPCRTFGHLLRGQSPHYTRELTDLVQECLYELPVQRPYLEELKTRVRNGYLSALHLDPTPDIWEDFLPPPPGRPDGRPSCLGRVKKTGGVCQNAGLDKYGGYCGIHRKQGPQQAQQALQAPHSRRLRPRKARRQP